MTYIKYLLNIMLPTYVLVENAMKEIQIFIPDQALKDVNDILKESQVGGMSHYRIHGRGSSKSEEVAVGLGTMRYTPEYNPRTKIEVIVRDDQVDGLIHKIADKLRTSNIVGKIFVLDVPIALDIRTNKTGESAL
ncbi:MAG: P-II family nitrogen regulator [Nitrososphaeraceae archaeon]|jgi:nitrogen regulatory protein P-II 1